MTLPIVVVAHNIRSLWNVGSLFRSSEGFGVSHVHLTGYTACPPRKEISKTALGAERWVPWSHGQDPMTVIEQRKQEGYEIISLEKTPKSRPITDYVPCRPMCLIVGHEILGVDHELLSCSDAVLHIEMMGNKESFNVAVAAGIALFSLRCTEPKV